MSNRTFRLTVLALMTCLNVQFLSGETPVCEKLPSNNAQDECLEQELKRSEREMLSTYKHLEIALNPLSDLQGRKELEKLSRYDRQHELMWYRVTLRRLRNSQRLWLAYRDSTCSAYAAQFEEGNITGRLLPMCKAELTQQRTKWLQDAFSDKFNRGE